MGYLTARLLACLPACLMLFCSSPCAEDGLRFFVEYDQLAITTGSQGSTFGIPGVEQYTHFLRCARCTAGMQLCRFCGFVLHALFGSVIAETPAVQRCCPFLNAPCSACT